MRSLNLKFPDGGQEARSAGYAMLVMGMLALAGVLYQYQGAMDEVAYWDLRIASMDRQAGRKTMPLGSPSQGGREIKQEIRRANAVLSEIDLPWGALFDSVEYATSPEVALLSFQPDAAGRTMRMGGEAKSMPALLDFVSALEREPVLKDAYLLKYEIKQDDPQRPIIFSIMASWIEAS
ncbi:fimbrial assembly protein [Nitrosospira lacus]|uniref:Fimbrial assembly protein n=1 Tax=Nitrosospira lacus TaxID=1288494 RepID=A0A1W6SM64_9PROT|nr:PilN domain-containing protein [Nitrosospira lacus]ARO86896.1 fimbrial assembly protein [Nitrosospira lacus]